MNLDQVLVKYTNLVNKYNGGLSKGDRLTLSPA